MISGRPPYPVSVDIQSQHGHITLQVWRMQDGFALAQPLRSQLQFTPELVQ